MGLANCSQCGKVFNKSLRSICPACIEQMEQDYETVYQFLRDHGPAHIDTIHEETGVDKKLIMKFLTEGRFEGVSVTYKCESCGASITSGKLCSKCAQSINSQIEKMQKESVQRSMPDKQRGDVKKTSLDRYQHK